MSTMEKRRAGRPRGATRVKLVRPRPVDAHVGARIRQRRTLIGMSQEGLAEALGLTFQQVQKYERGTNRVSASKLFDMHLILDVPIEWFFAEMPIDVRQSAYGGSRPAVNAGAALDPDPLAKRESLEVVRAYYAIQSPVLRQRVRSLMREMAKDGGAE